MNRARCPIHGMLIIPALGECGKCAQLESVRAAKGRARQLGGATKEQLVDRSLAAYESRGEALIFTVPPPIVGAPGRMRYAGNGKVDRAGRWGRVPIAFDVKGVTGRSSYEHELVRSAHQLQFLIDWTRLDHGVGFLLLVDSTLELMWIIERRDDFERLLNGQSIPIRRSKQGKLVHLLPVVRPETDLAKIARGAPEYDFLSALDRARHLSPRHTSEDQ